MSDDPSPTRPGGARRAQAAFTIGDLAREFGVTLRTLRFYEDRGLLAPRREGLSRLYSRRDRARLKLILMGKRVGFPLSDIKAMLDLYELKDGTQLRVAEEKFAAQLDALREQRRALDQAIAELSRTLAIVSGMVREREAKAS